MILRIIAIGDKLPAWINGGILDYQKRIKKSTLDIIAIPLEKRGKNNDIKRIWQKETTKILACLKASHLLITLDVLGTLLTTNELANQLKKWQINAQNIDLIIGGPEGLDPILKKRANFCWSLSPLTLPHGLARLIVIEQIYRAFSILQNHPYHK